MLRQLDFVHISEEFYESNCSLSLVKYLNSAIKMEFPMNIFQKFSGQPLPMAVVF